MKDAYIMKTTELTGAALDWAVAKCEGFERTKHWAPRFSTDWGQGGSIIERENICLRGVKPDFECWIPNTTYIAHGTTQLMAAMRCYVVSKLGNNIDIPEELLK